MIKLYKLFLNTMIKLKFSFKKERKKENVFFVFFVLIYLTGETKFMVHTLGR